MCELRQERRIILESELLRPKGCVNEVSGDSRMSDSYLVLPASASSAVSWAVRKAALRAICAFRASDRTYPHCCKYTRDSPYLRTLTVLHTISGKHRTYNKFPCRRRARGATGSTMVWHAFDTSTSRICLRLMRFRLDLEPSVATSLPFLSVKGRSKRPSPRLTTQLPRRICAM